LSATVPRCLQLGQMIAISMDLLNSAVMSGGKVVEAVSDL
jgi:hypothetical protein